MKLALPETSSSAFQQLRLSGENLQDVDAQVIVGELWQHSFNVIANAS